MRYKNKYFREVLENDLKGRGLGVNIHCRVDGIHITVPPYPMTNDDFTNTYGEQILREDYDTEKIVNKIKKITEEYFIKVDIEKALYGDNIKIKLKVYDE